MKEKKQINISFRTGMIVILSPFVLIFLISLLSPNENFKTTNTQIQNEISQNNNAQTPITSEDIASEYGSSLKECLQKADSWFVEAKQTAREVLKEEKTRKSPYQDFIDQNASSESEIMVSLQEEFVDYKKECNKRF